jgi:DNA-binding CsgD family transcriptional regulator
MSAVGASEGLVIVDETYRVIALDGGARSILGELEDTPNLPESAGVLPQKLIQMLKSRDQPGATLAPILIKAGAGEYSCRAFTVEPEAERDSLPMLALHLKRELSVVDAVHQIGVDYHLTDREQEALIGVSMGLTSKELATRMKISPNTVKAFLRLIMIKMGVTTRAGIVGKLLDQNGRRPDN